MSAEKNKNVVITKKAREKLVKARAGAIALPKIVGMAFGNGGVDAGEEELFKRWLARNVLNMAVRDYGVAFARTADEACQLAQKVVSEGANCL